MKTRNPVITMFIIALLSLLSSCTSIVYKQQLVQVQQMEEPRKWLIFLDGTNNDISSDTNVKRLHSLVTLQNEPRIGTLYVEGVGVGSDVVGMGMGGGFGKRVRLAYEFLLNNYRDGDKIYIFGFSRGAFEARALTSMLHYIGLPDAPRPRADSQESIVGKLYEEMKDGFQYSKATPSIVEAGESMGLKPRKVTVLGLWDTVEALGFPQWPRRIAHKLKIAPLHVDVDEANNRYGDQLVNVEHVLHAVAIDDDREWIFTPKLVTRCHLLKPKELQASIATPWACDATGAKPDIHEVFFSGAHSDVGGGYADSDLSGVSLNWMITMLTRIDREEDKNPLSTDKSSMLRILPDSTQVRQDPFGTSHDPEGGWWSILYHKVNRNLAAYALGEPVASGTKARCADLAPSDQLHMPLPAFRSQLCVHPSVFERRKAMAVKPHENPYLKLVEPGAICVRPKKDALGNPPVFEEFARPIGSDKASCAQEDAEIIHILEWDKDSGTCLLPLIRACK